MGEEDLHKVEVAVEEAAEEASHPPPAPAEPAKDLTEEKSMIVSSAEEKPDESKALAVVDERVADLPSTGKGSGDAVLARIETEKNMSLIKAWEESEKAKVENRAIKKMASITAWENSKKATIEAELRKIEEELEKKKAEYAEKMRNKIALTHREAEEKRAMAEAKRCQDIVKAEDMAAKYRETGFSQKKMLGLF
ncbi:hypothetical protein KSP39_PZI004900 [Platanthera zijinensis]|uniref:Remorin n=1 Tax=Platanthera zijinensis TaxID=2320716 RepID=A0AAP0BXH5_9ASPA